MKQMHLSLWVVNWLFDYNFKVKNTFVLSLLGEYENASYIDKLGVE